MLFWVTGSDLRLQYTALAFFIFFVLLGLAIRVFRNMLFLFRLSILISLVAFTLQIMYTGGIHSPSLPQLMIIPILALFYKPKVDRYILFVLTLIDAGFIAFATEKGVWVSQGIPDIYLTLYTVCAFAYVSLIIFTFIILFRGFVTSTSRKLSQSLDELKRTTQQLIDSEKMASLGQMMAGIAHEINNPIHYIKGSSDEMIKNVQTISEFEQERKQMLTALDQLKDPIEFKEKYFEIVAQLNQIKADLGYDEELMQQLTELSETIKMGTEKTSDIVNSLRMYARQKSGQKEHININRSIKTSVQILKHLLPHDKILILDLDDQIPMISGNDGRLSQVFLNIIINAIHAVGTTGNIWISTQRSSSGKRVKISIKDNGPGIPADIQNKIFDPFFTTKEVGQGTGLGLSISKSIIEEHEGSLTFSSDENGTNFQILLPIY